MKNTMFSEINKGRKIIFTYSHLYIKSKKNVAITKVKRRVALRGDERRWKGQRDAGAGVTQCISIGDISSSDRQPT